VALIATKKSFKHCSGRNSWAHLGRTHQQLIWLRSPVNVWLQMSQLPQVQSNLCICVHQMQKSIGKLAEHHHEFPA
jgi:hypothetical protein